MSLDNIVSTQAFTWRETKDRKVLISYNGKQIVILKKEDENIEILSLTLK